MENSLPKSFTLNNGLEMPSVGFGTHDFKDTEGMVRGIVEAGYRHIDTAMLYGNEELVGEAIKIAIEKGVKREELFITTKLWQTQYADVEGAIRESLARLQLDYIDLYLVHWPNGYFTTPKKPVHVLWPEMEALVDKGLTKSIGVSNYNNQMVWDLLCYCRIKPVAN